MWKTFETFGSRRAFSRRFLTLGRAHSSVWLERVPDKDEVHGSSPCAPTLRKSFGRLSKLFFFAPNGSAVGASGSRKRREERGGETGENSAERLDARRRELEVNGSQ